LFKNYKEEDGNSEALYIYGPGVRESLVCVCVSHENANRG